MSEQDPVEQPTGEWLPVTDADKDLVRHELESILHDSSFHASRRYATFLRHVVEETLEGRGEHLKERILGVAVFGREADYDSNQDNVVRATATEIRKRLAQHYTSLDGTSEIKIALVAGSYVPRFLKQMPSVEPPPRRLWTRASLALLVLLSLGALGVVGWRMLYEPDDPLAAFWRPFDDWDGPLVLCMDPHEDRPSLTALDATASDPAASQQAAGSYDPFVRYSSAASLVRFALFIDSRGNGFRMRNDGSVSFHDLRTGPAIVIGTNKCACRLTSPLRFGLRCEPSTHSLWISDREHPSRRNWLRDLADTRSEPSEDYALISRFVDESTGQWVVVASGLHRFGTAAGLEFLSTREKVRLLAEKAPPGWDEMNLQLVISTKVVQGAGGPPRILESYFWPR